MLSTHWAARNSVHAQPSSLIVEALLSMYAQHNLSVVGSSRRRAIDCNFVTETPNSEMMLNCLGKSLDVSRSDVIHTTPILASKYL